MTNENIIPKIDDAFLRSVTQQMHPVIGYQEVPRPSTETVSVKIQGEIRHYARRVGELRPEKDESDTPSEYENTVFLYVAEKNPHTESFYENPKPKRLARHLTRYTDISTYHQLKDVFAPTVAEVIAQIPAFALARTVAYTTNFYDEQPQKEIIEGEQYYKSETRLFRQRTKKSQFRTTLQQHYDYFMGQSRAGTLDEFDEPNLTLAIHRERYGLVDPYRKRNK